VPNNNPIFSREGDIQGGALLVTASTTDFVGQNINTVCIFASDLTSGGFVQRLRFKAKADAANTSATVARVFINEGLGQYASLVTSAPTMSAATSSGSGSSLLAGTYYAKLQGIDVYGSPSALSTEVSTTITAGQNINWNWTALGTAASYRLWVGGVTNGQQTYFNIPGSATATYSQTVPYIAGQFGSPNEFLTTNLFYGEISLPTTAITSAAATVEIDYPMNIALPPGHKILVGLGTTVQSGWYVTAIGGSY
jgi:hypothetical protein